MRGISDEQYVIELLKTVRNNLFHGGKYPDGPVEEIARNREILRASLVVLAGFYHLLKVQPPFLLNASDCLGNAEFPDSL